MNGLIVELWLILENAWTSYPSWTGTKSRPGFRGHLWVGLRWGKNYNTICWGKIIRWQHLLTLLWWELRSNPCPIWVGISTGSLNVTRGISISLCQLFRYLLLLTIVNWIWLKHLDVINYNFSYYLLVAVGSSGILKAKQKLGVTFNFDKQDVIDFTKFLKMTMCRA